MNSRLWGWLRASLHISKAQQFAAVCPRLCSESRRQAEPTAAEPGCWSPLGRTECQLPGRDWLSLQKGKAPYGLRISGWLRF